MFTTFSSKIKQSIALTVAVGQLTLPAWADKGGMNVNGVSSRTRTIVALAAQPMTTAKSPRGAVLSGSEVICAKELEAAQGLLQHKSFGQADASLDRAVKLARAPLSRALATKFAATLNAYMKYAASSESIAAAMKLLTIGGITLFEQIDDDLEQLCNDATDNDSLDKAEALMKARIKASKNLSSQDERISDWYLRLSEVELTLGNTDESDRLFNQVEKLYVARDEDADKVLGKGSPGLQKRQAARRSANAAKAVPVATEATAASYGLKHGISAPQIDFGEDTTIQIIDSTENKLIETKLPPPDIYCSDSMRCKGAFKFGGIIHADKMVPDVMPPQSTFKLEKLTAEQAPPSISPGADAKWISGKQEGTLLPGTYKTDTCAAINSGQLSGRTRVYLVDDSKSPSEFEIKSISPQTEYAYDLQIIYDGTKTIKLSDVIGVIYAPNAQIDLSGAFAGSIVARKLTTAEYTRLYFDQNLVARRIHP
ncbi:MAG TPA: hypothetical protein V6C76_16255 [Drouetiella sp.]